MDDHPSIHISYFIYQSIHPYFIQHHIPCFDLGTCNTLCYPETDHRDLPIRTLVISSTRALSRKLLACSLIGLREDKSHQEPKNEWIPTETCWVSCCLCCLGLMSCAACVVKGDPAKNIQLVNGKRSERNVLATLILADILSQKPFLEMYALRRIVVIGRKTYGTTTKSSCTPYSALAMVHRTWMLL